jgi:TolB-like protein/Tfp pilus assembly protein PilF
LASDLQQGFRLGPWKIEPLRGALIGADGEAHHLEPKVMDVLLYLAEHANELVSRDELLDSVWSRHVAADELLTGAVSDLRRALQEGQGDLKYIETIPKRGYRLIGEVRRTTSRRYVSWATGISLVTAAAVITVSMGGLQEWWPGDTAPGPIDSIAVLPLENFSGDPEQEYFTDGMTEALIAELGHIKALRVTSRTSVEVYDETDQPLPQIADELGVDALIEGSVLWAGDEVRITVQLLHGPTDQHLWSESFRRPMRDILTLQREVAQNIAREIKVTLSPQEESRFSASRSVDSDTYTLWLKGNFHLAKQNEESFRLALASYQEAIDRDAEFAPAYAGMAMAYIELGGWLASVSPSEVVRFARKAAEQALVLDPSVGDAHLALGRIRALFDWDWAGADRAFEQGIAMQPGDTAGRIEYANFLTAMGRFEESIEIGRRTLELDPLSPPAYNELGFALWRAGHDDEAQELYLEGLEIAPDFPQSHAVLSEFYLDKGDFDNALAQLDSLDAFSQARAPMTMAIVGRIYGLAGRQTEARALLAQLLERRSQEFVPATAMAYLHLGLTEYDEALRWLEVAYLEHDVSLLWLKENWIYDPLRSDPRFQAILDGMDFPEM